MYLHVATIWSTRGKNFHLDANLIMVNELQHKYIKYMYVHFWCV